MTTVADHRLSSAFPFQRSCFYQPIGGDWSKGHPIDLRISQFHPQAYISRDISGNLQYSRDDATDSVGQQDVVRLVA